MTTTDNRSCEISSETLLDVYRTARLIRAFDDHAQKMVGSAQAFFVHKERLSAPDHLLRMIVEGSYQARCSVDVEQRLAGDFA